MFVQILRWSLLAGAAAVVIGNYARAAEPLTIGYQSTVEPAKVAQADGLYEKAIGRPIEWRKFDSGADVIAAIASGGVQIGYVGSSPLAAAASRELPVRTILVAIGIGDAEALVVRNGAGIAKPADLAGKAVAVPFVSTTHYSLLAALKHWGIDPASLRILNLRPPEIAAAWQRGDIDAAYVWDPALGKIKETGTVLVTSTEVAGWGAPTFDAWIARADLIAADPAAVQAFADVTLKEYAAYRADPKAWSAESEQVAKIAKLTGAKPEEIPALLQGSVFPVKAEQAGPALLGGGTAKAIADTATFLKEQGKIDQALEDYGAYVDARFVAATTATN
ncbi:taurine ABC transporter substrate-binding protein [Mycobacterium sp. KBS0706]|uniref:taurine ABC transporter substrate-binding protein n=1 Tax=Mycobacterium sp. KBS0706 TaxID=2578109 RepID=UPI00110F71DF|nr:taurine ABC transporter substrate-binding protein [Mycobacterium sp. KBS0706]TSD88483.1 taurine ABC transporter substrate-binding protein [Mycobacterium sp. KBS0706]